MLSWNAPAVTQATGPAALAAFSQRGSAVRAGEKVWCFMGLQSLLSEDLASQEGGKDADDCARAELLLKASAYAQWGHTR